MHIYKILTSVEASSFRASGFFVGNALDRKSGFIHMSRTLDQCSQVRSKYYKDVPDLRLLTIRTKTFPSDELKYEGINAYPHLYAVLPYTSVIKDEEYSR